MDELPDTQSPQTYLCLEGTDGSKLEVDLITFREKGQQVKYLSIGFVDKKQNTASLSLDQDSFNNIKTFFKQLDWNG